MVRVFLQVVTVAVYSYFLAGLFGNQFLEPTLYRKENITGTMQLNPVREPNISGETWGPPYYTCLLYTSPSPRD